MVGLALPWHTAEHRQEARAARQGHRSAVDALSARRVQHGLTEYWRDGIWHRTLLFARWPSFVTPGWLARLLYLGGDVTVAQHVRQLSAREARLFLHFRRAQHKTDMDSAADGDRLVNVETETAQQHVEGVTRMVRQGYARLFSCGLAVTVRAPTLEELDRLTASALEVADTSEAAAWPADGEHLPGYLTTAPLGDDRLGRKQTLDTTALALSFPFVDDNVSMGFGQLWGVGATKPDPVLLDLRATDRGGPAAPHAILAGASGSGKTTQYTSLWLQQLTTGAADFIYHVDPKNDQSGATTKAGGVVIYFDPSTEATINAFDLPPAVAWDGRAINPVLEQVQYLLGWLMLLLCAKKGETLDGEEYGLLELCLVQTYRGAGITERNPDTWTRAAPVLSDLYDVLQGFEHDLTARRLARRLFPYCGEGGSLARLFSRPTTSGLLDSRVVSFNLELLQEHLRPAAVHLIGNHVWREARRQERRILLGLDETRTLLDKEESAVLVGDLFAKGRSYGVQVISMSQSLLDYERNPQGLRALDTTYVVALFKHEKGSAGLGAAAERYGLTREDQLFLADAPTPTAETPARAVLCTHRGKKRVEIVPSPMELVWKQSKVGPMKERVK